MSKPDVATYFTRAGTVDANECHDQATILPCKYRGSIRIGGQWYRWEFSPAVPAICMTTTG
jgi:hypothetical protein